MISKSISAEGKKILQNLCYDSLGWDEKIPENVAREWEYWKEKSLLMKNIQIDKCLKPSCGFEDIVEVSLHLFSDASELEYGQCSYIRLVTRDKEIHCRVQIGKALVSPKKFVSMLRVELTTAVLSVRVANQFCSKWCSLSKSTLRKISGGIFQQSRILLI